MLFRSIVASNFLAHAQVLAESLRAHHRSARVELLVVDEPDEPPRPDEPFRRLSLDEAGVSRAELHRRATAFEPQGLVSSLKPRLLTAAVDGGGEPALLLDADMLALGALDDVFELAARHAIVLTPHATVPLPFAPGGYGAEQTFLRSGVLNGGFVGVSPAAGAFLRWWDERSARDCVWDPERGIVASQTWLTLVPALFDHHVLRDRGVNLMGHGLGGDDVEWAGDAPAIDGTPLRLFHFAGGFDPRSGELGGPRSPDWWPRTADRPGLARLCAEYGRRLIDAGHDDTAAATPYGKLANGTAIDWAMRAAYRTGLVEAEAEPPNPFTHGTEAFVEWLAQPVQSGSAVSRYLAAVHAERADVSAAFPEVPGGDEAELLAWVAGKHPDGRLPDGLPTAVLAS
jgi:hypothetical protein